MELTRKKMRLGDVLINDGAITRTQLEKGLELQKGSGKRLGITLVDEGITTEEAIARALSRQLGYDMVDLGNVDVDEAVLGLLNPTILKKYTILPFEYSEESPNIIRVAMSDPMDMTAIDDITIVTSLQVEPVVATPKSIMMALDKYFGQSEVMSALDEYTKEKEDQMAEEEDMYSEDVTTLRLYSWLRR